MGQKKKVTSSSTDSFWLERMQARKIHPSWFRFAQWARSIIRFHSQAPLVLLGHRDAILFGDLVANSPSVVMLDPHWPSATGCGDILGEQWLPVDLIANLRALFFALRFSPYDQLEQLNRDSSSALSAIELHALRHADVVCFSEADQVAELERLRPPSKELIPACVPASRWNGSASGVRTLLLVADLEVNAQPLAPIFRMLLRMPRTALQYERIAFVAGDRWFELVAIESGMSLVPTEPSPASARFVAVLIFPGLLRDTRIAARWMTSDVPTQIMRSLETHPLQVGVESVMLLGETTIDSLHRRLVALTDEASALRREVVEAQARLARKWSAIAAIERLSHATDVSLHGGEDTHPFPASADASAT